MKVKVMTTYVYTRQEIIEAISHIKPWNSFQNDKVDIWLLGPEGEPVEPIDDNDKIEFTIEKIEEIE